MLGVTVVAHTGVDVSAVVKETDWECLMDPGGQGAVEWISVRAYTSAGSTDSNAPVTIKNAKAAGIKHVSAYIIPCQSCE